jgi:cation transporter-like permease
MKRKLLKEFLFFLFLLAVVAIIAGIIIGIIYFIINW